jgi:hypothetical protein
MLRPADRHDRSVLRLHRLQRRIVLERMAQRSAPLLRSVRLLRQLDRAERRQLSRTLRRLRMRELQFGRHDERSVLRGPAASAHEFADRAPSDPGAI